MFTRIYRPAVAGIAAACLLALSAPVVIAGPSQDAAFRALFPKAEAGNPEAMFAIGRIYLDGSSSAGTDAAKGMDYISRAANAGYKPAMVLVIDRVESRSLEMCMRLQKLGDNYCEAKLPAMVSRAIPKTLSAQSCKKIDDFHQAGVRPPALRFELAHCVVRGFSSLIPPAEALAFMRSESTNSRESFLKTMDVVLKANTADWDPLFVEDNLSKAGLSFKDKEVNAVLSRNGITLEGCRRLDPFRRETLKQRPSVCRMAAKSGDGDAALYVGEAYLMGKDYFPKDGAAAVDYIAQAQASANPHIAASAFALMLALLQSESRFYDYLSLIDREISRKGPHQAIASAALKYPFDYLTQQHTSLRLEDIITIVSLAEIETVSAAQKMRVAFAIDDVLADRGELLRIGDREMLRHYRIRLGGPVVATTTAPAATQAPAAASHRQPTSEAVKAESNSELQRLIQGLRNLLRDSEQDRTAR